MAKSAAAQHVLAALDAELAANRRAAGTTLEWSAAEQEILGMIGDAVDRREDLREAYQECESTATRLKIATELRLTEQAVSRLLRVVSTDVAAPLSVTSQKASRAARARWDRERMKRGG